MIHDRRFIAFDETPIHYYFGESENPVASLVIVHGAGEYAQRYLPFIEFLNQNHWDVYALDLRGYGSSGGDRAYAKSFDDYAKDILALIHLAEQQKKPVFLLGHSFGGLVSSYFATHHPDKLKGLVLSSPCFGLSFSIPKVIEMAAVLMSWIRPKHLFATKPISEVLTHDEDIVAHHKNDPKICRFMSAKLYILMLQQMADKEMIAKEISIPIGLFISGEDRVVDKEMAKVFFEAIPHKQKDLKEYPEMYHEILQEVDRQSVYHDILSWLSGALSS